MPVRQPRTLRDADEHELLDDLAPEVIVVAAYGLILPREVLDIPEHGCVNVHASLLPRWRGAAPVQRAILAGDRVTGVSIMQMEEGLDTGPYDSVVEVPVDELDAEALTEALAEAGASALLHTLERIERGEVVLGAAGRRSRDIRRQDHTGDVALRPRTRPRPACARSGRRAPRPQAGSSSTVATG